MNNQWLRFIAVPALAGGMLFAAGPQTSGQAQPPAATVQHPRWQKRADRIAAFLGLTDAQKEQAQAELQAARTASQPVRQQLKQLRQEMFQAIKANDQAKISQLSAQQGALQGQMAAIRDQAFARIYSNLTPDQQAKVDQLPAYFHQMRQQRKARQASRNNG
jgi:Spy/CpxP family protein refolding chaperone